MNKYEVTLAVRNGKVKHVVRADSMDDAIAKAKRAHNGIAFVVGCKALAINGGMVE